MAIEYLILHRRWSISSYLKLSASIMFLAFVYSLTGCRPSFTGKNSDINQSKGTPGTYSDVVDTDGDGLSDFQEINKYFTDPAKRDSDGDNIPDGDWNERREYTYSVRTILQFMPPFDEDVLNDDFQDARVLEKRDDYTEIEIIHYPFAGAYESIPENRNWRNDDAGMTEYLKPGATTNWDTEMKKDLLDELKADGIIIDELSDKQVVEKVSSWLLEKSRYLDKVFTTMYVYYADDKLRIYPGLESAFEGEFNRDKDNYTWTIDQHFEHEVLGKGMFYNKTHGSCTSTALYLTTVLRAVGIPTRMITLIPLVDASNDEQIIMVKNRIENNKVRETMLAGLRRTGKGFTNHTINEVYINGHWYRLNYNKLGQNILDSHLFGLQTHLYTFNDLSEANLAPTWGWRYAKGASNSIFKHSNPYSVVTISDLFGCHSNIKNPLFTAQNVTYSSLPNIFIMEPQKKQDSDFSIWDEVLKIVKDTTYNKTGRLHRKEFYDNIFNGVFTMQPEDVIVLFFSLDTDDRIPESYEDLLPGQWDKIEAELQKGNTVELRGKSRDLNIILLAAPKREELKQLIKQSTLLRDLKGKI